MFNIIIFSGYIIMLVGIGIATYMKTSSSEDYSIAGRSNNMWVTAISASSSDMSGWLLLGLPGLAFVSGYGAIWTLIGILVGNLFNWTIVANRLRTITAHYNAATLTDYFEKRLNDKKGTLGLIAAIIIVIFMIINSSAEIIGSGKLLNEAFGLTYNTGILISVLIVLAYTFLGGYLAVSWSNLIQGTIVLITLVIVPIVGLMKIGGINEFSTNLMSQDVGLFSFMGGENTAFGMFGLVMGGLGIGIGYPGQPHVLTSFMSIRDPDEIRHSTVIAMIWVALTTYGAVISGMIGRAISPVVDDPETIFLVLTRLIFPSKAIGLIAAAVMAAILSSVSAYLLVAATALASNVYKKYKKTDDKDSLVVERVSVVIIALLAFAMSLSGGLVFKVALFAWGGLAASFGPLIVTSLYWPNLNKEGAKWSMIIGMGVNLFWYYSGLSDWIYELIPAIVLSVITIFVVSNYTNGADEDTKNNFNSYLTSINAKVK